MGTSPTKAADNIYCQCRKAAAKYNDKLNSREGAAELLGISPSTLADYELGITKIIPADSIMRMADLYNAPELRNHYNVSFYNDPQLKDENSSSHVLAELFTDGFTAGWYYADGYEGYKSCSGHTTHPDNPYASSPAATGSAHVHNFQYGVIYKAQNKARKSQMTDREYILLLLKENPSLTQVELSEMMDKSRRTVQMLMKELLDEGVIERIGSKKKGSWLVK